MPETEALALTVADVFRHPSFNSMAACLGTGHISALESLVDEIGAFAAARRIGEQNSDLYQRFSLLQASNITAFLQTHIVPQVSIFRGGLADVLPATDFQSLAVAGLFSTLDGC